MMLVNVVIVWFHAVSLLCIFTLCYIQVSLQIKKCFRKIQTGLVYGHTERQKEREGATYQHSLLGQK
jgi:hypothetical protein